MTITLAENIRAFRKERALTQEQLAETFGVTVGAVHKWEAGLSVPDLSIIVEMADFFDTSVDVLLGYQLRDNRRETTVARLRELRLGRDSACVVEAEKALKKYPNCFDVVYHSAGLYHVFGIEHHDRALLLRCLELFERSLLLIGQNGDDAISEISIYTDMAHSYACMDRPDKAVKLLKEHNPCGVNDDSIGLLLATDGKQPDAAVPYLSTALLHDVTSLVRVVTGFINLYLVQERFAEGKAMLEWILTLFAGLKKDDGVNFLDKMSAFFLVSLGLMQFLLHDEDAARASLKQAMATARAFDEAPSYDAESLRFIRLSKPASTHDDVGDTATDGILNIINNMDAPDFVALWREIENDEKQ